MAKFETSAVFARKQKPKPSKVFATYWQFASLRQEAFFARLEGLSPPWSSDKIISEHKFTNAYRASDRVSQFLIKNVIYSNKWSFRDTVFRTLLFKIFNKIETWELLESQVGEISLATFDVDRYAAILDRAMYSRASIYSAAYIMPSGTGSEYKGMRKHRFHLLLIEHLISNGFSEALGTAGSMSEGYRHLLSVKSFGRFLAYQFVTDLNYSDWFHYSESEFVVPGPGALDGIRKCFLHPGEYDEADIIKLMADEQQEQFERFGLEFRTLWGRPLKLIDCQNLFCEVDKYARVAHPDVVGISGRMRIKQKFTPNPEPLNVWYPPKWNINEKIRPKRLSLAAT